MKVSVVIPVFNAAKYVQQAAESALAQPETSEVILVEDGSADESLVICERLAARFPGVRVLSHPDRKNRGAAAARNTGMRKARYSSIAFLDADDYYLPGRFTVAKHLLMADPNCDGVYEAIGMDVEDDRALARWNDAKRPLQALTTMTRRVEPENLWRSLLFGGDGYFSMDGLVVRSAVLGRLGHMTEALPMHEDTEFVIRLSMVAKLLPGRLAEPVAMRRVHANNRISAPRSDALRHRLELKWRHSLWRWSLRHVDAPSQALVFRSFMAAAQSGRRTRRPLPWAVQGIQRRLVLLLLSLQYPAVLTQSGYWRLFVPHPAEWGRQT